MDPLTCSMCPAPIHPGPTHRFAPHHDVLAGVLQ